MILETMRLCEPYQQQPRTDPAAEVQAYLTGLAWDGIGRLDRLVDCFDQRLQVATWLSGFVLRPFGQHRAFPMLVITGTERSTLIAELFAPLQQHVSTALPDAFNMCQKWLIQFEGTLTVGRSRQVGELLGLTRLSYRFPYYKEAVTLYPLAGVVMTANRKPYYLPDHNCHVVKLIRTAGKIDADQIWAEIYHHA